MATQVETRLPGNPLAKAEEHGKVIHAVPDVEEGGRDGGARLQTGVGDQGSSSSLGVGQGGNPVTETSERTSVGERSDRDSDDKPNEESAKSGDRKEFAEAPPPKVNPWTRKMNAVTVVSVNGQTHHGLYTPFPSVRADFGWVGGCFVAALPSRYAHTRQEDYYRCHVWPRWRHRVGA